METHHNQDLMNQNQNNDSDDPNGDGESVWSPDIEQCFREALLLFPPCGRRKHILQDEAGGKMYGRNELIARHIMMRTGKSRTRKQVSSHIQVLARRKAKTEAGPSLNGSNADSSHANNCLNRSQQTLQLQQQQQSNVNRLNQELASDSEDFWRDRPIATSKIRLVEFSAFIEYRNNNNNNNSSTVQQQNFAPYQQDQASVNYQATNFNPVNLPGSLANEQVHYQSNQQQQQPLSSNHQHQFNNNSQVIPPTSQINNHQIKTSQQQPQQSLVIKHSYIRIDYSSDQLKSSSSASSSSSSSLSLSMKSSTTSSLIENHHNKSQPLESININLIQDKFPELNGSDGLYQRAGLNSNECFFLIKFWVDLNNDYEFFIDDNQNSFFGFSSHFETIQAYQSLTCSIKACSYGSQVVEKVEKVYGSFNPENQRYSYNISRSPMCEFMIQFIKKLRSLPKATQMNSVLENFTVLQVITNELTSEILLCLAYVFEIAGSQVNNNNNNNHNHQNLQNGSCDATTTTTAAAATVLPQYHVYKLTKD